MTCVNSFDCDVTLNALALRHFIFDHTQVKPAVSEEVNVLLFFRVDEMKLRLPVLAELLWTKI